ncbi:hypothetical protein EDC19_0472 [Natranaerovirga hydrolytica]|uniref:Uncharacterized protein n=1 Tax=Natranaerovirga hydrolytica TaxID=680378 RepID=A0A4R1MY52_9FIRM|nr:hypothetical protein [Natranaerovirga hydrolytica]TCK98055.1 hypothetical protein EDC19_0472 [Natranaerovirga hydrolytica]
MRLSKFEIRIIGCALLIVILTVLMIITDLQILLSGGSKLPSGIWHYHFSAIIGMIGSQIGIINIRKKRYFHMLTKLAVIICFLYAFSFIGIILSVIGKVRY